MHKPVPDTRYVAGRILVAGVLLMTDFTNRRVLVLGLGDTGLLDDTYNANPDSVRAAIALLAQAPGNRLLVLGDMGELGPEAPRYHFEAGETARAAGIEGLLTLGQLSAEATRGYGRGARHFTRIEDLLAELENRMRPDVTALVKGSRFMRMERIVQAFAVDGQKRGTKT